MLIYLAELHYDDYESKFIGLFSTVDKAKMACQDEVMTFFDGEHQPLIWFETGEMVHAGSERGGYVILPHFVDGTKAERYEIDILNAATWYAQKVHQEILAKQAFDIARAVQALSPSEFTRLHDEWEQRTHERKEEEKNLLEKAKKANRLRMNP